MKPIADHRLWLFDLDDTLVDWTGRFKQTRLRVGQEAAQRFGLLDAGQWSRQFDEAHHAAWPRWEAGELDRAAYRRERFRLALEAQGLSDDDWVADIGVRFIEMCRSYVKPDPRVQQLLDRLRQSHLLAVLTNGFSQAQRDVLRRAGLLPFFPHIFTSEETGYQKPDDRAFTNVLTTLSVSPAQTVFIGDSWSRDIAPAHRLGLHTVWVNPDGASPSAGEAPDLIVQHVSELLSEL